MNIIVFEDEGVPLLFPITTGRPAYAITCGSYRLIDWLTQLGGNLVGSVRPHLETLQLHDFPQFCHPLDLTAPTTWLINARTVPSVSNWKRLQDFRDQSNATNLTTTDSTVVARCGWAVASALVPTRQLADKNTDQRQTFIHELLTPARNRVVLSDSEISLLDFPHDVVKQHMDTLTENLDHRIEHGDHHRPESGVHLAAGVNLGRHCLFDTKLGPVVIGAGVNIGPFSLLRGPIFIGANTKISEYAAVKDHVAIGHTCKIGGEVEASIIEPYSNKQHHGFLGHSYLGSWINLGAGTCNSDLKNTYGTVNVEYGERKMSTEMQFFGCVMGDYVKTAINTSIFTGKMIGTASMVYGSATANVPSFVNYALSMGEIGNLPPEVVVSTQARMFARRNVKQRPCDAQLIHDMFQLTADERPAGLSDEPIRL